MHFLKTRVTFGEFFSEINSYGFMEFIPNFTNALYMFKYIYSVETTYGINSVKSILMTFVENAETG
jgi:hypothetical protein